MDAAVSDLVVASVYRREIAASLERVWENVFDWEHLPALHPQAFASVELLKLRPDGYDFALISQPGDPTRRQTFRLQADKAAGAYAVRTETGPGAGGEIRTRLTALEPQRTGIEVSFMANPGSAEKVRRTGEVLQAIYTELWDQDEAMMQRREAMLALPAPDAATPPLALGAEAEVRIRAPFTIAFGGRPVRIAACEGEMVAFSAVCPHWLGPLDAVPLEVCIVRCPWHDYRFDLRTGQSADGRGLRLEPAPRLVLEAGQFWLRSA